MMAVLKRRRRAMNRTSGHVGYQLVAAVGDAAQRTIAEAGWILRPTGTVLLAGSGVTDAAAMNRITYLLWGRASLAGRSARMLRRAAVVPCPGIVQGPLTHGLITATVVALCSNGGVLKGTLHDTLTLPPHQAPPSEVRSNFNGTLLIAS